MSLLYTITAYPPSVGGAQLHLHELVKHMRQREHVGVVYQWDESRTDWLRGTTVDAPDDHRPPPFEGVPVHRLGQTPEQKRALRWWVRLYLPLQGLAIDRIEAALRANLQSVAVDLLGGQPSLVHNSRIGREGLTVASYRLAREWGVPFVFTPNHHHHWRGWFYQHYLKIYRAADAVIAYTEFERDELVRLGVRPEQVHILGIGPLLTAHGDGAAFRQAHDIPDDAPLVLFLGQKYAYKRIKLLLQAAEIVWGSLPDAHFAFIGPRTSYSQRLFSGVDDARVLELDVVDLQTKTDALMACDVMCMPSGKESFGGVFLEAWTLGKPVIGGDAPAVQQVIRDGETGFVVGDDAEGLALRLLELLQDPAKRDEMGAAGHEFARRYDWAALATRLGDIYDGLR